MVPTSVKTVHQTSLLHIKSNLDRLGLLSTTHGQRSQQQSGEVTLHSVHQQVQVSQGHTSCKNKENWNTVVHGDGGLELGKPARESASSRPKPCASLKNALRVLPVRRSLLTLVGRKTTAVIHQRFPQKPPGLRLWFSRKGLQHSPGSSTIELSSAFVESGAFQPDRAPPGSPRQFSLPPACRDTSRRAPIEARKRRASGNTIFSQPCSRRVSTDRLNREGSQLAASLEGEPGPTPAGTILPHPYPETRFRRERARDCGSSISPWNSAWSDWKAHADPIESTTARTRRMIWMENMSQVLLTPVCVHSCCI